MKPMDTIRKGIDSDLIKYHNGTLCKIIEIKDLNAAGILAKVVPLSEYEEVGTDISRNQQRSYDNGGGQSAMERYSVIILNRIPGQLENGVKEKYNVLILNTVQDRTTFSPAFLVPKSTIDISKFWPEEELKMLEPKAVTNVHGEV